MVRSEWPARRAWQTPQGHFHTHSLSPKRPAPVSFKHGQLVRPVAAGSQTVQVGPGRGCVAGMEVAGHTEGLQYPVGTRPGMTPCPVHVTPWHLCHHPKESCPDTESFFTSRLHHNGRVPGEQRGAHRMAGCLRWVLRACVRTSGEKGGRPERRWTSRCAALLRAWTPASVRLEIVNFTGTTEFSRSAAS